MDTRLVVKEFSALRNNQFSTWGVVDYEIWGGSAHSCPWKDPDPCGLFAPEHIVKGMNKLCGPQGLRADFLRRRLC